METSGSGATGERRAQSAPRGDTWRALQVLQFGLTVGLCPGWPEMLKPSHDILYTPSSVLGAVGLISAEELEAQGRLGVPWCSLVFLAPLWPALPISSVGSPRQPRGAFEHTSHPFSYSSNVFLLNFPLKSRLPDMATQLHGICRP